MPASDPTSTPRPSRSLPRVFLALAAVMALGAAGCVGAGGPNGGGAGSTISSASVSASVTAPAPQLTVADVDTVLGEIDYVESSDSSTTRFDNAVARMLRGIDLPAFAQATLDATRAVQWTDMGTDRPRLATADEKIGLVAEQGTYWAKLRDSSGSDEQALVDMIGDHFYPPTVPDRNRADSLLDVSAQGLAPLSLMFGARDASNGWTWRVASVSIVGTDSADVTYAASATPGAGWRFADPAARYTKRLRFSFTAEKGWRLSGWPNYQAVLRQFRSNLDPSSAVPHLDPWWGAL
jgi:hypothetical protein